MQINQHITPSATIAPPLRRGKWVRRDRTPSDPTAMAPTAAGLIAGERTEPVAEPMVAPTARPAAETPITPYQYASQQMRGEATTRIDLSDQPHLHDIPPIISSCRYLTSLNLSGTGVAELEALASLPRLERLALWGTRVRDLSALRTIKSLRWLSLGCTDVTNIEVLAELPDLEVLDLSHTGVQDLSPLGECIRMRELILRGTQITCIKPVTRMRDLMILDIAGTQVTETHPAKVLKNLSWFNTGAI